MTMEKKRWPVVLAVIAAALVAAGGIAYGVGSSEEQVSGPAAERAAEAALEAAGDGTVLEVERQDGDGAGVYEVEVRRSDGSEVEILLDERFQPVGTATNDDGAGDSEEDESSD
jgi:Peptidase propeptide and YPEB domain